MNPFILIYLVFIFTPEHAVYLSVVELKHEGKSSTSSISVKVFMDDLQNVIRNYNPDFKRSSNDSFVSDNMKDIENYFQDRLKFKVNDELGTLVFESHSIENDTYFLKFKMSSQSEWKKIEIVGDFFTEVFPDQSNVITITNEDQKYFARLTKSKPAYFISF